MAETDLMVPVKDENVYYETGYLALKAIIGSLTSASENLILGSLRKALENSEISAHINDGIMQYLYAAGFLSFAGREITHDNLVNVVTALGVAPEEKLVDVVLRSGIESHLVYVYAYYFLVASGKDISESNMSNVISAIGLEVDHNRIKEILSAF